MPIFGGNDFTRLREDNTRRIMDSIGVQWEVDPAMSPNMFAAYDTSVHTYTHPPSREGYNLLNNDAVPCPHCHRHTTIIHSQIINYSEFQLVVEISGRCRKCNAEFNMTLLPLNKK